MRSIAMRFLLPFGIVAILFSIFIFHETYVTSQDHANDLVGQQAAMAMEFNQAIREYVAETVHPFVQKVAGKNEFIPEMMAPPFVSQSVFEKVQQRFPGYVVRFASDNPRSSANRATPDEMRMIEFFRRNPQITQRTEQVQINNQRYVAQFKVRRMKAECLRCHGNPQDAPTALVKQYGATAGFYREVGDVVGLDTVAIPVETVATAMASEITWKQVVMAMWLAFLFGLIIIAFHLVVSRRLSAMARHIREIAATSEISRIAPREIEERDEIDVLRVAFDRLFEQLRVMQASLEQRVKERTADLAQANVGLKQQIAERQRAEEAMRESEEKFRSIVESSPAAMHFYRLEPDNRLILTGTNPAAERIIGNEHQRLTGKPIEEVFPNLRDTEVLEIHRKVARGDLGPQTFEMPYKDERVFGFYDVRVFRTGPGLIASIFVDITERKQAEQELRAYSHRLALATEAAVMGVWEWSVASNAVTWDDRMFEMYGLPSTEAMTYQRWTEMIHAEDVTLVERQLRRAVTEKKAGYFNFRIIRGSDSAIRHVQAAASVIVDERGQVTNVVGVNFDITARKLAEEEIRKLNLELEQRVADRTIQLAAANRELESFAYSVSHDLTAPLRGIDGWGMALLEDYSDRLDERARQYLSRIRAETQRMGQLIDDLLKLSRVTRAEMRPNPVDLTALAESIAARLQEDLPHRQLEFVIQQGLSDQGDERLLRIALNNLLGNAVKFTSKQPQARIEFGLTYVKDHPAYFVRDNGAGFDMAFAKKLFGAFQRMHKASEFPGTGIGLATVQRIIQRHGGRIWAEAHVNQGAIFYFTLDETL
jgi:PAS domain S-box-containing protein